MTESEFHHLSADEMEALRAKMVCVKCGAKHGECDCWIQCKCGWKYHKTDTGCSNHECKEDQAND